VYDIDIAKLTRKKNELLKEKEALEKLYTASFEKVVALETSGSVRKEGRENYEETNEEEDEVDPYELKGKQTKIQIKPAEAAKKKKQEMLSATNFRATMATTQQELLEVNQELEHVSADLDRYLFHQEIALKCLVSLRRIINQYRINNDIEYVKKGAYFVRDYSLQLLNRYTQ
jgi:hypothetical protein